MSTTKKIDDTLLERIGGVNALVAVIEEFYGRLLADNSLKVFFENVDNAWLKKHQKNFLLSFLLSSCTFGVENTIEGFFTRSQQPQFTTVPSTKHQSIPMTSTESPSRIKATRHELEKFFPRSNADGSAFETTPEGNEALTKGSNIYRRLSEIGFFGGPVPTEEELEELTKERLLVWFGCFYRRLMQDPRMMVLFDTTKDESNVSAFEHGKRLALALLSRWTGDPEYYELVGQNQHMIERLNRAHSRAKQCPMRSSKLRGKGFTTQQRDSWLGHLYYASSECDVPDPIKEKVVTHLGTVMDIYRPFVRTEVSTNRNIA